MEYSKMSVKDLRKMCKENKIRGYSKLKKKELIDLLETKKPQGPVRMRPMSPLLRKIEKLNK